MSDDGAVKVPKDASAVPELKGLIDPWASYTVVKVSEKRVIACTGCWAKASRYAREHRATVYCYDGSLYRTYEEGAVDA